MTLTINKEFLRRHLFVVVLMAGMGAWFGYDGFVRYPSLTPARLYADAHNGTEARSAEEAEKFYRTAIPRQKEFMTLCLGAALLVGLHLLAVSRLRFAFDEGGFTWKGRRYAFGDIRSVDRSKWDKKGILKLTLADGTVTLDGWHHVGVDAFEKLLGPTCGA